MKVFRWHSINLIPTFTIFPICEDDPPYDLAGSMVEIVVFGIVFHFLVATVLPYFSTHIRGPLWSRKYKHWYLTSAFDKG